MATLQSTSGGAAYGAKLSMTVLGWGLLILAISAVVGVDRARGRARLGWAPGRRDSPAARIYAGAALLVTFAIATALVGGTSVGAVYGRSKWPLSQPQVEPAWNGLVAASPSNPVIWVLGLVTVSMLLFAGAWASRSFGRSVAVGLGILVIVAMLTAVLPVWLPIAGLPQAGGIVAKNRGELALLWLWPAVELNGLFPSEWWKPRSVDGVALAIGCVGGAAIACLVATAAVRRTPS